MRLDWRREEGAPSHTLGGREAEEILLAPGERGTDPVAGNLGRELAVRGENRRCEKPDPTLACAQLIWFPPLVPPAAHFLSSPLLPLVVLHWPHAPNRAQNKKCHA